MTPGPGGAAQTDEVRRLQWIIRSLREHCPWTRLLTHEALVEYLVEESYEVLEEIESGRRGDSLRREMGDLLFQVVLHAQLAQERDAFDLDGVAEAINAKLVRRNPHVFTADGALQVDPHATIAQIEQAWDRIKAQEKAERGEVPGSASNGLTGPDDGVGREAAGAADAAVVLGSLPAHLPALAKAAKLIDRMGRLSTPGPDAEVTAGDGDEALAAADEAALGELLFAVVRVARAQGQDPERALRNHLDTLAQ